jgi:integrase
LAYELSHGLYAEPSKMPWQQFCQLYLHEKFGADTTVEDERARTIEKAEGVFDKFASVANVQTIGDVTERRLSAYAAQLRGDGYSPFTIKGHLAVLRAALRWAKSQKIITQAPDFKDIMPKLPKGKLQAKVRKAGQIGTEAFERLLMKRPNDEWRLLTALAWHCGLRRNGARAVRGDDMDLKAGEIHIHRNKARDESQTVVIPPELEAMLRERWPDGLPKGALITVEDVPSADFEVSRRFKHIARRADVGGSGTDGFCTLHDLKRSYGTPWAPRVPAQVLKSLMRHSSLETTLSFYADVKDAGKAAVRGKPASQNDAPNTALNTSNSHVSSDLSAECENPL